MFLLRCRPKSFVWPPLILLVLTLDPGVLLWPTCMGRAAVAKPCQCTGKEAWSTHPNTNLICFMKTDSNYGQSLDAYEYIYIYIYIYLFICRYMVVCMFASVNYKLFCCRNTLMPVPALLPSFWLDLTPFHPTNHPKPFTLHFSELLIPCSSSSRYNNLHKHRNSTLRMCFLIFDCLIVHFCKQCCHYCGRLLGDQQVQAPPSCCLYQCLCHQCESAIACFLSVLHNIKCRISTSSD